jgi:hypothetical protein
VDVIALAAKSLIAVMLLVAGGAKLADVASFATAVRPFVPLRVPRFVVLWIALGVAIVEFACEWSSGSWVHCTGYGNCHYGYTLCQDCKPNSNCNVCICVSAVICGQCCTPTQVRVEQKRVQELMGAAS